MPRRLAAGLAAVTLATVMAPAPAMADPEAASARAALPTTNFPLGRPGAAAQKHRAVAAGIDLFTLDHGTATEGYTVSVLKGGKDVFSEEEAGALAQAVEAAGLTAGVQRFTRPGVADYPEAVGHMVRVGLWDLDDRAKAAKTVGKLKDAGISSKVDYLGDDGTKTTGPWDVRVLTVDPRAFRGSYHASIGTSVAKRETPSSMAKRAGAVAAVNGGFFNIHTESHLRGEPVGVSVVDGRLLSEAVAGRSALVLKGRTARVTEVKTTITAKSVDGERTAVTGVNRVARADELVLYTEEYGAKTPSDDGAEAVLDSEGSVIELRPAGGRVKPGTRVLHGTGIMGDWIWSHAWETWKVDITSKVVDLRTGKAIPLTPETSVIGGGVGLVRNGRERITAKADGHASINMIMRRHPRTIAGVTKSGKLLLATVDGRKPGVTVGASMIEAAHLMLWLGARQAINLDGGGSSAMVVKGKLANRPSDGAERPVGDALLVVP
ncbi:phosphodiester glycosidase family protein [Sphaerisporangium sp. TRM90804]|uniref:phosphodiester glycosidase family protein n=1 Tax=Sphaerisporangium sp. TRM90804 TaxID=3031113 RepID=UPI00244B7FA5|nr:phosphodiester glycosidase family protein [Sphaerisporangium sp. TRM90804]MDH2425264.1 phosphodiester glycosidase family protein [Sphaerisporangium sp. TRM90804]